MNEVDVRNAIVVEVAIQIRFYSLNNGSSAASKSQLKNRTISTKIHLKKKSPNNDDFNVN